MWGIFDGGSGFGQDSSVLQQNLRDEGLLFFKISFIYVIRGIYYVVAEVKGYRYRIYGNKLNIREIVVIMDVRIIYLVSEVEVFVAVFREGV